MPCTVRPRTPRTDRSSHQSRAISGSAANHVPFLVVAVEQRVHDLVVRRAERLGRVVVQLLGAIPGRDRVPEVDHRADTVEPAVQRGGQFLAADVVRARDRGDATQFELT